MPVRDPHVSPPLVRRRDVTLKTGPADSRGPTLRSYRSRDTCRTGRTVRPTCRRESPDPIHEPWVFLVPGGSGPETQDSVEGAGV